MHSEANDPVRSQSHDLHPVLLDIFQWLGAHRSQDMPTTFGKHGHCPVLLSQTPLISDVPRELHTHP